jgi:type I restriction enzyme, R subunit
MNKKSLSEADICSKFITPAVMAAGWDEMTQVRREVSFTKGRIIVRGKLVTRGKSERADYILYYKPNIPIALIEAKENNLAVGAGMQQALKYAATLDIPFVFSSNGDAFLFHDRTGQSVQMESELPLDSFPSAAQLWTSYRAWKGLVPEQEAVVLQDYYEDPGGKEPRYYQQIAINRTTEAIAKGQDRAAFRRATARIAFCRMSSSPASRTVSHSVKGIRTYASLVRGSMTCRGAEPVESRARCCSSVR